MQMDPSPARHARGFLAAALVAASPLAAQAQQAASGAWTGEIAIYGWFPAIGGTTSFPPPATGTASIDVSSQDVIDALKFALMGQIQLRNGKWGLWSDLVYGDFGANKSGTRDFTVGHKPVAVDANLDLDIKSWIWTVAGTYNLESRPESTADLVFGARLLDLSSTLAWSLAAPIPELPTASGTSNVGASYWDAIAGVKGRVYFGEGGKWFVPYYADIGAGQSKSTWQVNAGIGYKFNWGAMFATWRYLSYRFKSSSAVENMTMNGPLLGVAFQF